jgi:hypothetical protein
MQTSESVFAIILILIIGAVIFVFAYNHAQQKQEERYTYYQDLGAVETAQALIGMQELRCAKTGATATCIDRYKATTLAELTATDEPINDYYYNKLGYADITLTVIHPDEEELIIYSKEPPEKRPARTVTMPITVHDPGTGKNAYATLNVKTYEAMT